MAITPRGMEPANIKKRLDTLFPKLNETYPDKVIRSLAKDHKKWAETVTELYRALGYPDSESFLKAYGYTVERGSQGRPSGDHTAIIDELKKRYPNGAPFEKMGELQAANPDLAGKFKTLSNRSKELFGMTLADYFKSIGLLGGSDHKKQLDELLAELKSRYPAGSTLPATLTKLKEDNADLMMTRLVYIKEFYGENPQEFLVKEGLIKEIDPKTELANFVAEIRERYAGKLLPGSLDQLKTENGDLPFASAAKWVQEIHGTSLVQYLKKEKIIDLESRQLQAAEKVVASKPRGVELEFVGRAFVTTDLSDSLEEKVKEIVQSRGGFFRTAVSKNTAYLITHENIPKKYVTKKYEVAQEWNAKGVPICIMSYSEFIAKATQQMSKNSTKTSDFLIKNGTLVRYLGKADEVTLPDEVVEIGNKAFAGCNSVLSIKLNNSIKKINRYAFKDCNFLRKISIEGNNWANVEIQSVAQYVATPEITFVGMPEFYVRGGTLFRYFGKSAEIHIPGEVTTIDEDAFKDCNFLRKVSINGNNWETIDIRSFTQYISSFELTFVGMPEFYIKKGKLLRYFGTSAIVDIPDEVLTIGDLAFKNNIHVEEIRLNNHIASIGDEAFANCLNLKTITLPISLSEVGKMAFSDCISLKNVTLPKKLAALGDSAFENCIVMEEITFPDKLTVIPASICSGCQMLSKISLGSKTSKIEEYAFFGCSGLTDIVFPDSLRQINNGAFRGCHALENIKVPNKIKKISGWTFASCSALQRVELSEELTTIEQGAFMSCVSLKEVIFYEGLRAIGEEAFLGCRSLTEESFHVRVPKKEAV